MKVAAIGNVIRTYRKASGISQKDLAALVGISRATLNYLESGRDIEVGASKLLALLDLLGIPFSVPGGIDREHDDEVLERAARAAAGKGRLPRKQVVEGFATGRVPAGAEGPMAALLEGTPEPEVMAIVRAVSAGSGQSPKAVWRNGRSLAKAVGCDRPVWRDGGS